MLITFLLIVGLVILATAVLSIADNLIQIEAKKSGLDTSNQNFSLFPSLQKMFNPKTPSFAEKDRFHKLTKGHDILMVGGASGAPSTGKVNRFAVQPTNYRGIAPIPKMLVAEGDEVKAGDALFYDKPNPDIKYTSPVSGEVVEIKRGEKRAITEVIILADKDQKYKSFDMPSLDADRDQIITAMKESGSWVALNSRPFDVVADSDVVPRDIFISGFDTGPLSPETNVAVEGNIDNLQKGVDVLNSLTDGKVYLSLDGSNNNEALGSISGAEKHWFKGPHPAGNVGVQIHHIHPIGLKDTVWTVQLQDVINISKLFLAGKYDQRRVVAVAGGGLKNPKYIETKVGANISELIDGDLVDPHCRIISGDVLSGETKTAEQFVNAKDDQITVIPEGDKYEMFGWLLPLSLRPSISKTFPNFLFPNHKFNPDTNTHGEGRAFVMTGQYESMLPMNIYPQHLMKAVVTNDYERMEGLGINELSEEDIALCEFACTSKQPLQSILREGLEMMREQL